MEVGGRVCVGGGGGGEQGKIVYPFDNCNMENMWAQVMRSSPTTKN